MFLDIFSNFELQQSILEPTDKFGNILDLLQTDKSSFIADIKVSDTVLPCTSDHFCLSFAIKSKFKRLKILKEKFIIIHGNLQSTWQLTIYMVTYNLDGNLQST